MAPDECDVEHILDGVLLREMDLRALAAYRAEHVLEEAKGTRNKGKTLSQQCEKLPLPPSAPHSAGLGDKGYIETLVAYAQANLKGKRLFEFGVKENIKTVRIAWATVIGRNLHWEKEYPEWRELMRIALFEEILLPIENDTPCRA